MSRLRTVYGSDPLHLISIIAMFAFVGYVVAQVFDGLYPWNVVLWFGLAIIAHDFVGYPLYTLADRIAQRGTRADRIDAQQVPAINYVRVPAFVSGVLLVVWFPLILGLSESRYMGATGLSTDVYLPRWLAITGCLFAASTLLYAFRLRKARRSARQP